MIYKIDGTNVGSKLLGKRPKISLSSGDDTRLYSFTTRAVKLVIKDTVVLTNTSRLEIYYSGSNLLWTGEIDWFSQSFDTKKNTIAVTFLPDSALLKGVTTDYTASNDTIMDILTHVMTELGTPWVYDMNISLGTYVWIHDEFQILSTSGYPHPNDQESIIQSECFYSKVSSLPMIHYIDDSLFNHYYSKLSQGTSQAGIPLPSGYSQVNAPNDVRTPLSGNVGYGFEYNFTADDKYFYFIRYDKVWCYGRSEKILGYFTGGWEGISIESMLIDFCKIANLRMHVIDKTIYLRHYFYPAENVINTTIIDLEDKFQSIDYSLSFTLDIMTAAEKQKLYDSLEAHYDGNQKRTRTMKTTWLDKMLFPGEDLIVDSVKHGVVKSVVYDENNNTVAITCDRFGMDS